MQIEAEAEAPEEERRSEEEEDLQIAGSGGPAEPCCASALLALYADVDLVLG